MKPQERTNHASFDPSGAVDLLRDLVAIPSFSGNEHEASNWLVHQMKLLGYQRCYVDEVGNAVGEMGDEEAEHVVVLLGHIDTVPGDIPVRIEQEHDEKVLYGRGTVDAKGPLAIFVMAVARLGAEWATRQKVRLVVVGAVEEEAATSRGARFIRDRFDGHRQPLPVACIIGEPSSWSRITMGYKGRLLVGISARQPMAHTAGPDAGIAVHVVKLWNWIAAYADAYNYGHDRLFEQLQPSLRDVHTGVDSEMNDTVDARIGIRLPLAFDVNEFVGELVAWYGTLLDSQQVQVPVLQPGKDSGVRFESAEIVSELTLQGYEPAWRSTRSSPLVRAFLGSIRQRGAQPGFVVKTGTADMNVVGPAWNCPIVAYGPGDSTLDHTPIEHISLTEYTQAIDVLVDALNALCSTLHNTM